MITPVDFIADQLRAATGTRANWDLAGIDRARELAAMFVASGVVDLSHLQLEKLSPQTALQLITGNDYSGFAPTETVKEYVKVSESFDETGAVDVFDWVDVEKPISWDAYIKSLGHVPFRFLNGDRAIGFLGDTNRDGSISNRYPVFQWLADQQIPIIAWSSQGDGNVSYCILIQSGGFVIVPFWASSSEKRFWLESLQMIFVGASLAFSLGTGASLARELGNKILSATIGPASPWVSTAVGNAAIGTALSGGDVESAVKSALIGAGAGEAGALVGGSVASATEVQALGRVASAATSTYIRGGNVDSAIGIALLSSVPDLAPSKPEIPSMFDLSQPVGYGDVSLFADDAGSTFYVEPLPSFGGSLPGYFGASYGGIDGLSFGDPLAGGYVDTQIDTLAAPSSWWDDTARWFGDTFSKENLQTAVTTTRGIADIVKTVRSLDAPSGPQTPTRAPATPTVTGNPDGTYTVRAPNGSVQVVTGEQLRQMQAGGGAGVSPALMLGGAALLGLLLFR